MKKSKKLLVEYPKQFWRTFKTPPAVDFDTMGPSGVHIWVYDTETDRIFLYVNYVHESSYDKFLWCYHRSPCLIQPKPRRGSPGTSGVRHPTRQRGGKTAVRNGNNARLQGRPK